ncbi:Adenine phosphoribosyltransferase, partial [Bienertia sinuspersici]
MVYSMLSDITPEKESWKIKVRIIRLWYQPAYNNPNVTESLELVLVDQKVHYVRNFYYKKMVMEGCMRLISHFGVVSNTGKHRPMNHAYKMNFFFSTVVKECENMQLP